MQTLHSIQSSNPNLDIVHSLKGLICMINTMNNSSVEEQLPLILGESYQVRRESKKKNRLDIGNMELDSNYMDTFSLIFYYFPFLRIQ